MKAANFGMGDRTHPFGILWAAVLLLLAGTGSVAQTLGPARGVPESAKTYFVSRAVGLETADDLADALNRAGINLPHFGRAADDFNVRVSYQTSVRGGVLRLTETEREDWYSNDRHGGHFNHTTATNLYAVSLEDLDPESAVIRRLEHDSLDGDVRPVFVLRVDTKRARRAISDHYVFKSIGNIEPPRELEEDSKINRIDIQFMSQEAAEAAAEALTSAIREAEGS